MKKIAMMLLSTTLLSAGGAEAQLLTAGEDAPLSPDASATTTEASSEGADETATQTEAESETETVPSEAAAETSEAPAETSSLEIEEIVVTSRKRTESIQTVPIAVTAMTGDMMEKNVMLDIGDVDAFAPNVQIAPVTVNPGAVVAYIRGVGNRASTPNGDSPVAISIDGVYLTQVSGGLVDVFDMQSIEVLRGPQGTLQGRNSPGGALNLTTRRPSGEFGAKAEVGIGRFGRRSTRVAVEAPLVDEELSGRLSVGTDNFDGQFTNTFAGTKAGDSSSYVVRGGLLYTPTEDVTAYFTADYSDLRYGQVGLRYVGTAEDFPRQPSPVTCTAFSICTPTPRYTTSTDYNRDSSLNLGGTAATIDWRLDGVELTSVSGYREVNDLSYIDLDATSTNILTAEGRKLYVNQLSQEFRLQSRKDGGYDMGGRLDWVTGVYYMRSRFNYVQPINLDQFGIFTQLKQRQTLDSYAVFAHGVYALTDRWSVSAGGRQSFDDKKSNGVAAGFTEADRVYLKGDWSNFSFDAGTEFKLTPDHLVYLRYAQGYRSGGIDEIKGNDAAAENQFKPETVDTIELGAKTEWLDRRLQANFAVFYSDYADLQRDVVLQGSGGGVSQAVRNAASATIQGIELETQFRATQLLSLRATAAYLDAKYDKFIADLGSGTVTDNSDLDLPFAPKFSGMLALDYDVLVGEKGILTLSPDVNYQSKSNLSPLDSKISEQDGYALVNASATFTPASDKWGFSVYARNIFDKYYIEGAEPTGGVTGWELAGLRRTWGVRMFAHF